MWIRPFRRTVMGGWGPLVQSTLFGASNACVGAIKIHRCRTICARRDSSPPFRTLYLLRRARPHIAKLAVAVAENSTPQRQLLEELEVIDCSSAGLLVLDFSYCKAAETFCKGCSARPRLPIRKGKQKGQQGWMLLEEFSFISLTAQMIIGYHVYLSFQPP